MKKFKLLAAIAITGLLGLSAYAIPSPFCTANFNGVILINTNSTVTGTTTHFNVTKLKVTNKDVLGRVAAEFGAFPAGAQLVLRFGLFGQEFSVLSKTGTVLLLDASVPTAADSYSLVITQSGNDAWTGQNTPSTETFNVTSTQSLHYSDATAANTLTLTGPSTAKEVFGVHTDPESFRIMGSGNVVLAPGHAGIVTGTISGAGGDSADF